MANGWHPPSDSRRLYVLSRLVEGRSDSPSELIVDSQSVKTAMMIAIAVGYDGAPFYQWAMDTLRWVIWVVLRPEAAQGFVLLEKRWKVKRNFGWFKRY